MKKFLIFTGMSAFFLSCGGGEEKKNETAETTKSTAAAPAAASPSDGDAAKGIGKFTNVELAPTLDDKMAESGLNLYDVKCSACHKLTEERLVGPGWKGVTTRRRPEWIMNFTTNIDEMLAKDPEVQAQLEVCLVRMPNQNLSDDDARHVLEFMRKNDGVR